MRHNGQPSLCNASARGVQVPGKAKAPRARAVQVPGEAGTPRHRSLSAFSFRSCVRANWSIIGSSGSGSLDWKQPCRQ